VITAMRSVSATMALDRLLILYKWAVLFPQTVARGFVLRGEPSVMCRVLAIPHIRSQSVQIMATVIARQECVDASHRLLEELVRDHHVRITAP